MSQSYGCPIAGDLSPTLLSCLYATHERARLLVGPRHLFMHVWAAYRATWSVHPS